MNPQILFPQRLNKLLTRPMITSWNKVIFTRNHRFNPLGVQQRDYFVQFKPYSMIQRKEMIKNSQTIFFPHSSPFLLSSPSSLSPPTIIGRPRKLSSSLNERLPTKEEANKANEKMNIMGKEKKHNEEEEDSKYSDNAEKNETKNKRKLFDELKKLFSRTKYERKLIFVALICLAISSGSSLLTPFIIGKLIDCINLPKEEAEKKLKNLAIYLASLFVIGGIATIGRVSLIAIAGQKIATRLRKNLFKSILSQEVAFFDKSRSGELVNRLNVDVQVVSETLTQTIVSGTRSMTEAIGGIILLCYLSMKLTFVAISVFPALGIGAVYYGKYVKNLSKEYMDSLAHSNALATEKLSHIRTVRYFGAEKREISEYDKRIEETYHLGKNVGVARGLFYGAISTITNFATIGILSLGALDVIQGTMTVGTLSSFLLYSIYIGLSFTNLSSVYSDLMKTIGSSERIFELLERVPSIPLFSEGKTQTTRDGDKIKNKTLNHVEGDIEFKDVSFRYENNEGYILSNVSLKIQPSNVVAIVGFSGSGKSTILSLLARLYDIESGQILLDGHDIRELDIEWLRYQFGVVSQEPVLFSGTIAENITYGLCDEEISREDVINAAKKANAHEFIMQFPQGYDTMIGEHSVTLSGGQKQRIAIARAIIKNPRILVLDEATSSLDAESEHAIQEALFSEQDGLTRNRTTIVIAHRLSTIMKADMVAVLNKGNFEEVGTHQSLLQRDGLYKQLITRQLGEQILSSPPP